MLFVALLSVAAAVSAAPLEPRAGTVVLPLSIHQNVTSIKNIVDKGAQRINAINSKQQGVAIPRAAAVSSGTVTNEDVSYIAPVVIGGTTYDLIVDTGCKSADKKRSSHMILIRTAT